VGPAGPGSATGSDRDCRSTVRPHCHEVAPAPASGHKRSGGVGRARRRALERPVTHRSSGLESSFSATFLHMVCACRTQRSSFSITIPCQVATGGKPEQQTRTRILPAHQIPRPKRGPAAVAPGAVRFLSRRAHASDTRTHHRPRARGAPNGAPQAGLQRRLRSLALGQPPPRPVENAAPGSPPAARTGGRLCGAL
jgi:hypothetical protein